MSPSKILLVLAASAAVTAAGTARAGTLAAPAKERSVRAAEQVVAIEVTRDGFVPAKVTVKAGAPVKLVVTRKVERTCATEIVLKEYGVNQPLPLGQPVEVKLTPRKPGNVRYACGMDMIAGVLAVE